MSPLLNLNSNTKWCWTLPPYFRGVWLVAAYSLSTACVGKAHLIFIAFASAAVFHFLRYMCRTWWLSTLTKGRYSYFNAEKRANVLQNTLAWPACVEVYQSSQSPKPARLPCKSTGIWAEKKNISEKTDSGLFFKWVFKGYCLRHAWLPFHSGTRVGCPLISKQPVISDVQFKAK